METDIDEFESPLNDLQSKQSIITLIQIYDKNYYKNLLEFYTLLKIRILNQIIYDNKYFHIYKKLYALRNIILNISLKSYYQNNIKKICFNFWYNIIKDYNLKLSNKKKSEYYQLKREAAIRKVVLNKILENNKIKNDVKTPKKLFLILIKFYNYLFDRYYIRSIVIARSIYKYIRKRLKYLKSQFYSRIDYNYTEEDIINIYKYILISYNKENFEEKNKYKKEVAESLIIAYNKTIKHNYDYLIKKLCKENVLYIILFKTIFNKCLINKDISCIFSIWKQNTLDQSIMINFQLKEKYTNNLIYSKIYLFILVIKKIFKHYFELLYNNINKRQTNGLVLENSYELLSILNFESLYDNYLINVLKGLYKIENFKNMNYSRIFKMNNKNKKILSFNVWKRNNKNIICNYIDKNIILFFNNINIIKGAYIFDKIYSLSYNKRILNKINILFISYSYNINKKKFFLKIKILYELLKSILYRRQKFIFNVLLEIFRLSKEEKILKNQISIIIGASENILFKNIYKSKISFFLKLKYKLKNIDINISKSNNLNYNYIKNFQNSQIKQKANKLRLEAQKRNAVKKLLKFFIKNSVKKHFLYSLKNAFNHWCLLVGYFPKSIRVPENMNKNTIYNNDSEDEEDIITQKNEINELKKCLKEDQDFQHDLKAKITALDEENEFIGEKIFEITQRVEKCEKCSNLLKSSYISDNNIRSSKGSMIKYIHGNNNNAKKSRNIPQAEATSSSGLNFYTGGTDLIPRRPQGSLNQCDEASDPGSEKIDDMDENINESNDMSQPYLFGIKKKIMDLKQEKEPIINKLKEEIKALYLELNMS